MTGPRQSREDRSADQLLAGKYVLGLLSEDMRRDVEARMRRDRGFARMVTEWDQNMADAFEEDGIQELRAVQPMATRRGFVRRRGGRRRDLFVLAALHLWRSATLWRSTTLILFVLVLTLLAA